MLSECICCVYILRLLRQLVLDLSNELQLLVNVLTVSAESGSESALLLLFAADLCFELSVSHKYLIFLVNVEVGGHLDDILLELLQVDCQLSISPHCLHQVPEQPQVVLGHLVQGYILPVQQRTRTTSPQQPEQLLTTLSLQLTLKLLILYLMHFYFLLFFLH